ncbi:MAG: hypothetical protein MK188_09910 [Gammaproteobacteria bacterium]|nr:hypothetical protein [Gammaproteobacteria bacterium]
MKQKHKIGNKIAFKPVKRLLAPAVALAFNTGVNVSHAADKTAVFSTLNVPNNEVHKRAYSWLNQQSSGQTLQFATVYGLKNCQQLAQDFESYTKQAAYCFESSTKPNRFFAVSGAYSLVNDARQASEYLNLDGFIVSSIDKIKQTRCNINGIDQSLAPFCSKSTRALESNIQIDTSLTSDSIMIRDESSSSSNTLPSLIPAPIGYDDADQKKAELFTPATCSQLDGKEIRQRRRPGFPVLSYEAEDCRENRLQAPRPSLLADPAPVPDRWRIVDTLGYAERWWDPYNGNNTLKGDKPIFGKPTKEWFFNLSAISDTVLEPRNFPLPVGAATTRSAGQLDLLADGDQFLFNENLIVETVLYRGDTVFRPPDHEFRLITVFNLNHTVVDERGILKADPGEGTTRTEGFIGIQGAFWDYHIRNVSDRYDFDSFRIGIQPFSSDFRGFLFQDNQFGVRFFGTRDNNIFQYNVAWFRRMEKEINSGLNDIADSLRDDDIFTANLYWQDFPSLGFISQASITHNRNREADDFFFDDNAFIARPSSLGFERGRDYDVTYLGLSGDGHFGRNNLTYSAYYAFGDQSNGVFTNDETDISAYFFAAELSRDFDWVRARASFLHSSGDDNPFDNKEKGFDAIFENPQFAGGDTAFFIRQNVPLIGGGRVALNSRNSIIPSLRSSKELGQSNFTNPGITLVGIGADLDLTPQTRLSFNLNQMWFDDTTSLELARNQSDIRKNIGQDISAALIWRPFATQNAVVRLSGAVLNPGSGFKDLYGDSSPYSILANVILAY